MKIFSQVFVRMRFAVVVVILTMGSPAMAQELAFLTDPVSGGEEQSDDLQQMKNGQWVVVDVQRDGGTVPATYGQNIGDVITLRVQDRRLAFG